MEEIALDVPDLGSKCGQLGRPKFGTTVVAEGALIRQESRSRDLSSIKRRAGHSQKCLWLDVVSVVAPQRRLDLLHAHSTQVRLVSGIDSDPKIRSIVPPLGDRRERVEARQQSALPQRARK